MGPPSPSLLPVRKIRGVWESIGRGQTRTPSMCDISRLMVAMQERVAIRACSPSVQLTWRDSAMHTVKGTSNPATVMRILRTLKKTHPRATRFKQTTMKFLALATLSVLAFALESRVEAASLRGNSVNLLCSHIRFLMTLSIPNI